MPFSLPILTWKSYKYQRLDPEKRQIRTFSFNAVGKEKHAGRVRGEITGIEGFMHTESLDNPRLSFQAISYAWTKGKPFKKVQVRDFKGVQTGRSYKELKIPEDVYNMLLHFATLRNNGVKGGRSRAWGMTSRLWIDQICINQKDPKEKSWQVGLMNEIYGKADNTLIWLGFPSADSDLAIDFVENFDWNYYDRVLGKPPHFPGAPPVHPTCADVHDPKPWVALRALLSRTWWTRTWIIQEATLTKYDRQWVVCGTASTHLFRFGSIVQRFQLYAQDHALMPPYMRHVWRGIPFMEFLFKWNDIIINMDKGLGNGLVTLMRLASAAGCTEHRDRIFALLSISSAKDRQNIRVDYESPTPDVLLRSFAYIIRKAGLTGLQLGKLQKTKNFDLPSWLPDLGTEFASGQWLWHRNKDGNPWLADGTAADWNRIGGLKWTMPLEAAPPGGAQGPIHVRFSSDLRTVACRGIAFDTIETAEPAWLHSKAEIDAAVASMLDVDPAAGKERVEQLERIVEASGPAGADVYPNKLLALLLTLVANRFGAHRRTPKFKDPKSEGGWAASASPEEKRRRIGQWFEDTSFVCNERSFVITTTGYFGLAPPGARRGDLVCVLYTAHVPFVLRKKEAAGDGERCYEFVGDAYVHGISEGEIFEWAMKNEKKVEEFWIQ